MNKILKPANYLAIFAIPALMIGIIIWIAKSTIFIQNRELLSAGITADLLLTIPLIYLFLIRKSSIPKTSMVPVMIAGMLICSIILPKDQQYFLGLFKTWGLPMIELFIITYAIYHISKAIKRHRHQKTENIDFYATLKKTCYEILPRGVVIPVVTEIAVFYYGFISWKARKLKANEFSYHKDSGTVALLVAIIFMIIVETVALHFLIQMWNGTVAWIFTALSIYTGIQLFGFLKSLSKRPISIHDEKLDLPYGIMNETTIELNSIESIEISSKDIEVNEETRKLAFLGQLESHNVILHLKHENEITGLYGIKRKYRTLALHVDKKEAFVQRLEATTQLCSGN